MPEHVFTWRGSNRRLFRFEGNAGKLHPCDVLVGVGVSAVSAICLENTLRALERQAWRACISVAPILDDKARSMKGQVKHELGYSPAPVAEGATGASTCDPS